MRRAHISSIYTYTYTYIGDEMSLAEIFGYIGSDRSQKMAPQPRVAVSSLWNSLATCLAHSKWQTK